MKELNISKPEGFENYLGELTWVNGSEEVPYSWGWEIIREVGDPLWNILGSKVVDLYCAGYPEHSYGRGHAVWYAIAKKLTMEEYIQALIKKHGKITNVKVGPKGGFQYVTFGKDKQVWDSYADPTHYSLSNTDVFVQKHDSIVTWDEPTPAMKALAKKNALKKAAKERAARKKAIANGKIDKSEVIAVINEALKKKFGLEPVELIDGYHKKHYFLEANGGILDLYAYEKGKSNFSIFIDQKA